MDCTSCGTTNDPGRKFCLECGTPLAVVCPACGSANPAGAKYCGECGARVSSGGAAEGGAAVGGPAASAGLLAVPAAAAAPVAERRLVSILFADLVGFTSLAEDRDAEDVRDLLSRYFELARSVVERHGGTVEKFIGDAVMAVWGTPTSHEDDAERAVRASLEIVAAVRSLGPALQARAGVVTGEAAVTLGAVGEGMVAGDMVNTASRLQSVAPPGTVLVNEATMHAASRAIVFEPAGEQLLRGKASPVPAWRAKRVVSERGGRGRSEALEAPFVGREDELRLLKDLYHATARERRVRLVSITGQAGIGKSRLAWEFLKYIDGLVETVYWHEGRSPSYGSGITFWALGEMVRERAGLAEADDEATTRHRITETVGRWIPDERERRWVEAALLALLGVGDPPPGGQEQLFAAWRTFFERVAAEDPVAMVFEDLQWADSGLLAFIDHLADWSRGSPIYIVALARPELLEARPDWGAGKRSFTSLALEPLAPDAMRELIAGLVPGLPADAAARIVRRADGIPLYAVEIVRMLVTQGALEAADGVYRPTGDLADLAVPETLHSLIAARLDALDPGDRAILQAAAVLGQSFSVDGLAAVVARAPADVEPRLAGLVRRELLVRDVDPRSAERGQYAFVQSLVREVAYSTLARRDRKARHLAAARHLEALVDQELAGALASHYLAAYRNATEGAEADALAAQARIALRAAGDRAVALGAPEQAVAFYRDALEVTTEPLERAALLERGGQAASAAALHDDAERMLRDAIALLRVAGDRSGAARVTGLLGDAMFGRYRIDAALGLVEPAAAEFADLGEDAGLAYLLGQLARFQVLRNVPAGVAVPNADRALALADALDRVDIVADVLVTRGLALTNAGRAYEGIGCVETGLRLAQQHGLLETELRARINLGAPLEVRDPRTGLEVSRIGLEKARRFGHRQVLSMLAANAASSAIEVGDWVWARRALEEAIDDGQAEEDRIMLLTFLAVLDVEEGRDDASVLDEVDRLLGPMAREEPTLESILLANQALGALRRGDLAGSASLLLEAARRDPYNAVILSADAAELACLARDAALAEASAQVLRETRSYAPTARITLRLLEAARAAAEGRMDAARSGLLGAWEAFADVGAARRQALTGLVIAELLDLGDPAVRAAVNESRRLFENMGAGLWLARMSAGPSGGGHDAPPDAGIAGPTVGGAAVPVGADGTETP